jgi:hypothetical protein
MPETARLNVGDPYPCPRCRTPHVVEQPYRERSTAERTHLYVTCRGDHYVVGVAPREGDRSERGTDEEKQMEPIE